LAGVNRHGEAVVMSGGKGPQIELLTGLTNWVRDVFTGGRATTLEDEQRRARQARIDEYHHRHPDAPGSAASTTAHPDDQHDQPGQHGH
jgi:hypothetical protein